MARAPIYLLFLGMLGSACAPMLEPGSERATVRFVYEGAGKAQGPAGVAAYRSALSAEAAASALNLGRLPSDHCYAIHVFSEVDLHREFSLNPSAACDAGLAPKALGEVFGLYKLGDVAKISVPVGSGRRFHLIGVPRSALRTDGRSLSSCEGILDLRASGQRLHHIDAEKRPAALVDGNVARLFYRGRSDIEAGSNVVTLSPVHENVALTMPSSPALIGRQYACANPQPKPEDFPEASRLLYRVSATADATVPGVTGGVLESVATLRFHFDPPSVVRPRPAGWILHGARVSLMPKSAGPQEGCPNRSTVAAPVHSKGFLDTASDGSALAPNADYELRVCTVWQKDGVERVSRGEARLLRSPARCDLVNDGSDLDDFPTQLTDLNFDGIKTLCLLPGSRTQIPDFSISAEEGLQIGGYLDDATLLDGEANDTGFPTAPFTLAFVDGASFKVSCSSPECRGLSLHNLLLTLDDEVSFSKSLLEVSGSGQPLRSAEGVEFELQGQYQVLVPGIMRGLEVRGTASVGTLRNLSFRNHADNFADLQAVVLTGSMTRIEALEGTTIDFLPRSAGAATSLYSPSVGLDVGLGSVGAVRGFFHSSTGGMAELGYGVTSVRVGSGGRLDLLRDAEFQLDRGRALFVEGGVVARAELLEVVTLGSASPGITLLDAGTGANVVRGGLDLLQSSYFSTHANGSPALDLGARLHSLRNSVFETRGPASPSVFVRTGGTLSRVNGMLFRLHKSSLPALLFQTAAWSLDFSKTDSLYSSVARRCGNSAAPLIAHAGALALSPVEIRAPESFPAAAVSGLRSVYELQAGLTLGACP